MNLKIIKKYYPSGNILSEEYFLNGRLYRLDGPASINYYESGKLSSEEYCINNELHRLDGPACILYNRSGQITYEAYYDSDSPHRLDGPAIIYYDNEKITAQSFYVNGNYLPNFENYYKSKGKIFEYTRKSPLLIREVEILARHNKWLTEDQLALLKCLDMFT